MHQSPYSIVAKKNPVSYMLAVTYRTWSWYWNIEEKTDISNLCWSVCIWQLEGTKFILPIKWTVFNMHCHVLSETGQPNHLNL